MNTTTAAGNVNNRSMYGGGGQYNTNNNNMGTTTSSTANAGYYGNTSNATTASGGGMPMILSSGSINTNTTNPIMMGNQSTQPAAPASTSYNNDGNMMMMSGAMGSGPIGGGTAPTTTTTSSTPAPHIFDPNAAKQQQQQQENNNNMTSIDNNNDEDYENEPPLLEELGVNFPHIYSKSRAVLFPIGKHAKSLEAGLIEDDADLAGPLAFALGLGGELVLVGKMHFGYVYGFGLSGCLAMTLLLNLLNPNGAVSMWTVVSILGYALLPVNLLAGINILYRVHKMNVVGMALAVLIILWCTAASTRLFERGCQMRDQRFLVAYPAALLYSAQIQGNTCSSIFTVLSRSVWRKLYYYLGSYLHAAATTFLQQVQLNSSLKARSQSEIKVYIVAKLIIILTSEAQSIPLHTVATKIGRKNDTKNPYEYLFPTYRNETSGHCPSTTLLMDI
eukprot:scaffold3506_cov94-Skeletonema_marinoi.AAC.2